MQPLRSVRQDHFYDDDVAALQVYKVFWSTKISVLYDFINIGYKLIACFVISAVCVKKNAMKFLFNLQRKEYLKYGNLSKCYRKSYYTLKNLFYTKYANDR